MNVETLATVVAELKKIILNPEDVESYQTESEEEARKKAKELLDSSALAEEVRDFDQLDLYPAYYDKKSTLSEIDAFVLAMETQEARLNATGVPFTMTSAIMRDLTYLDAAVFWIARDEPASEYIANLLQFDPNEEGEGHSRFPRPSWALGSANFGRAYGGTR